MAAVVIKIIQAPKDGHPWKLSQSTIESTMALISTRDPSNPRCCFSLVFGIPWDKSGHWRFTSRHQLGIDINYQLAERKWIGFILRNSLASLFFSARPRNQIAQQSTNADSGQRKMLRWLVLPVAQEWEFDTEDSAHTWTNLEWMHRFLQLQKLCQQHAWPS